MTNNELNTLMIEAGISTNEAIVKTIKRYRYQVISRIKVEQLEEVYNI